MRKNILLILKREFSMKIRHKMFWFMAILGPFMLAAIMIVPVGLNMKSADHKVIEILDLNRFKKEEVNIHQYFTNTEEVSYVFMNGKIDEIKNIFLTKGTHDALLITHAYPSKEKAQFYSKSILNQHLIDQTAKAMLNYQKDVLLYKEAKLTPEKINQINNQFSFKNSYLESNAYQNVFDSTAASVGLTAGIMIYAFILLYGIQVMRGVIEEKSNRILEVLVIAVKPFELMMGKILGIGLTSILQFSIWVGITSSISWGIKSYFKLDMYANENIGETLTFIKDSSKAMEMNRLITALTEINLPLMLLAFFAFFILAYLLYSALFAAIGAAVDAETDTQQFVLPITIPLLVSFLLAQNIINNPDGNLAFSLSMFPFTSPIVMMLRLPFGVPMWQFMLSLGILSLSFLFFTFLSAKVFRVGILMYGKKVTFNELGKWLFYK
jgi:ABC-2 type transport system permease protein